MCRAPNRDKFKAFTLKLQTEPWTQKHQEIILRGYSGFPSPASEIIKLVMKTIA